MSDLLESFVDILPILNNAMLDVSHFTKTKVRISKNRFKWKYVYIEGLDLYKYSPITIPSLKLTRRLLNK